MKRFVTVAIMLLTGYWAGAQNQLSIGNILPAAAKQTNSVSSGESKMFILFQQFGEIPNEQKGGCTPSEVGDIHVKVEYYASGGKILFDGIMQAKRIDHDIKTYEEGYISQKDTYAGNSLSSVAALVKKDVEGGRQLSYSITTKCEDEGNYTMTFLSSYLVFGTTIIYIDMSYFGTLPALEKYAKETVDKIKKLSLEKM